MWVAGAQDLTLRARVICAFAHLYAAPQDVVSPSMLRNVVAGVCGHPGRRSMRDPGCGLRGRPLLRASVNKEMKGRDSAWPSRPLCFAPSTYLSPLVSALSSVSDLSSASASSTLHTMWKPDSLGRALGSGSVARRRENIGWLRLVWCLCSAALGYRRAVGRARRGVCLYFSTGR